MGEYADLIIDGIVDQCTGEVIDGHVPEFPRSARKRKKRNYRKDAGSHRCEKCGRHFQSSQAVEDHARDMHTQDGMERRRRQKGVVE